jgi:hypothetical protein
MTAAHWKVIILRFLIYLFNLVNVEEILIEQHQEDAINRIKSKYVKEELKSEVFLHLVLEEINKAYKD